ncbi:hypothetical protein [Herpetosiphon llansteffanensis]|uniref:hypothetical protein n=1 Tax=Herpetosiphon llansteffanensis TaxID=2094568 RepID=UPI000D7C370F|nr:hypothetical protein [Herpetosiphon llansteffanensis]
MQTTPTYRVAAVNAPFLRYGWVGWFLATWLGGWLAEIVLPFPIDYFWMFVDGIVDDPLLEQWLYWIIDIWSIFFLLPLTIVSLWVIVLPILKPYRYHVLGLGITSMSIDRYAEVYDSLYQTGLLGAVGGLLLGWGLYRAIKQIIEKAWVLIPASSIAFGIAQRLFIQFACGNADGLFGCKTGHVTGSYALEYYLGRGAQWAVYGLITALTLGVLSQRRPPL